MSGKTAFVRWFVGSLVRWFVVRWFVVRCSLFVVGRRRHRCCVVRCWSSLSLVAVAVGRRRRRRRWSLSSSLLRCSLAVVVGHCRRWSLSSLVVVVVGRRCRWSSSSPLPRCSLAVVVIIAVASTVGCVRCDFICGCARGIYCHTR